MFDAILAGWVWRQDPIHYRLIELPDTSVTKRYDAFMAEQVAESWVMRTYHAFVGGMSQLTALYPMVEPAYRARGGAMPTRRLSVEAAIFHTRQPATMEEFAKFCASSPYGPVLSPETFSPPTVSAKGDTPR